MLPETGNPGEEVPPQTRHGWQVSRPGGRPDAIHPQRLLSPPPPTRLTMSGAAIVKSTTNFLFHHKSQQDGEPATNGLVQPGNISKSLGLVDSVVTANGMTVGDGVTQPAGGYQVAIGSLTAGTGEGGRGCPLISQGGKQTFAEPSRRGAFGRQAPRLLERAGPSCPVLSKHPERQSKGLVGVPIPPGD